MYVYYLADLLTGDRLELLHPAAAPSWARRPEPVSWSVEFNVRTDPREVGGRILEGNPSAGLQARLRPWRDVVVVSWSEGGVETALAAGIVSGPLETDEASGTLSVDTVCIRTLLDSRFLLTKTGWPPTRRRVNLLNLSWQGLASEIVRVGCRDYEPEDPEYRVTGFDLPIDRPAATAGPHSMVLYGYHFKPCLEALEDVEDEGGVVVDFRPYWGTGGRIRWAMEVFSERERSSEALVLGNTSAPLSQATYLGTKIDHSELATVTHHTGKGSEVDVLYTRKSDTSPTVAHREILLARPDVETPLQLVRQATALYKQHRTAKAQDEVSIQVDPGHPDWYAPHEIRLGMTAQMTLEDSLAYGHATIQRTIVGWQAAGPSSIRLELQDLTIDSGV